MCGLYQQSCYASGPKRKGLLSVLSVDTETNITVYATPDVFPTRVTVFQTKFSEYMCLKELTTYIDYYFYYVVTARNDNTFVLRNTLIEVYVAEALQKKYDCTKLHPENDVRLWDCTKDGEDLFAKEKAMVGSEITVDMRFGSDFLKYNDVKYAFLQGGVGSDYCKENGDNGSWNSLVIALIVLGILALCGCCVACIACCKS